MSSRSIPSSIVRSKPLPNWDSCRSRRSHRAPSGGPVRDRKSTRLNSSHLGISYAVFILKRPGLLPFLHSSPPRRSSDLSCGRTLCQIGIRAEAVEVTERLRAVLSGDHRNCRYPDGRGPQEGSGSPPLTLQRTLVRLASFSFSPSAPPPRLP